MDELRMLALAAARRRVGYVFLIGEHPKDWRVSEKAARSNEEAAEAVQIWINELKPDVVVTEDVDGAVRKGPKTKVVIGAMALVAEHNYVLDIAVKRSQHYASKYEEAAVFSERYPEIKDWLPKDRRVFDNEPRTTVLIDALALAEAARKGPAIKLAAAMG